MSKTFAELIAKVKEVDMKTVAVSVAQDDEVLKAVRMAKDRGVANAILVGDKNKIEKIAKENNIDVSDFEIKLEDNIDVAALAKTAEIPDLGDIAHLYNILIFGLISLY